MQTTELRHIKRKKTVGSLPAASTIYVQVIQNGSRGHGKSLFLFTDFSRYLFNCPEGMQRCCTEYGAKLSRVENLFVTHGTWRNVGGFPGMLLTLGDVGVPELTIHGSQGISKVVEVSKFFHHKPKVKVIERPHCMGTYSDDNLIVHPVPFCSSFVPNGNCYSNNDNCHKMLSIDNCLDNSVAYICTAVKKPGKISMDKCRRLNVPVGPLVGKLQSGCCVTLDDGTVVHPEDVIDSTDNPPTFVVVECPSESFLPSLIAAPQFTPLKEGTTVNLIVHLSPSEVFLSERYQEWVVSISKPETQHLILNDLCADVPHSIGVFRQQLTLNHVESCIFPIPASFSAAANVNCGLLDVDISGVKFASTENLIFAKPLTRYNLRPVIGHEKTSEIDYESEKQLEMNELRDAADFEAILSRSRDLISGSRIRNGSSPEVFPELVFLGTGSAMPARTRNVSGILLNVSERTSVLLDCGEATYGQLCHFYGHDVTPAVLTRIAVVFISHLHADHHLGLYTLFHRRRQAFESLNMPYRQLYFISSKPLFNMFTQLSDLVGSIDGLTIQIASESENSAQKLVDMCKTIGDIAKIEVVEVEHPMFPYGIILQTACGKKIVYSGDTRPCNALARTGLHCDLLIHEATMEDDLQEDAIQKKHSTTREAIELSGAMNARFTILTHFSARYTKMPLITADFDDKIGIAFDFMRVSFSELHLLPLVIPPLKAAFWNSYESMLQITKKRNIKATSVTEKPPVIADAVVP